MIFTGNRLQKYELKVTLANCKQGGDSVSVYLSRLKKIWNELENYQQLPGCDSENCINTTAIIKEQDEKKKYKFFMGLNDSIMVPFN